MGKAKTSNEEIDYMIRLRQTGHSLPEIKKITGRAKSTVFRYIHPVVVLPEYLSTLKTKQGGSKERSARDWVEASLRAELLFQDPVLREKMVMLACLYWAEGSKKEFNLINGDPALIKVFVLCLKSIGVCGDDLIVSLRLFEDLDKKESIKFWVEILDLSSEHKIYLNILEGKKIGKLKYGLCRVGVRKGGKYFKLIMSVIDLIKKQYNATVVQWIEQGTPKS